MNKHVDALQLEKTKAGVRVFVNGSDLVQLLREYERPLAKCEGHESIAGGYAPVGIEDFLQLSYATDSDDVTLFGCSSCDEDGCWPMVMQVERDEKYVEWKNFAQPHRDEWDYSGFGPFTFDRQQYDRQIAELGI